MRNSLFYLAVLFTAAFSSSSAAEPTLLRDFATCTGRFSAEVEHSWLMESAEADHKEVLYENMAALLASVTSREDATQALSMRIDAKAAHAQLLLQAAFGWDAVQRASSKQRAAELLSACSSLILADAQDGSMKIWAIGTE